MNDVYRVMREIDSQRERILHLSDAMDKVYEQFDSLVMEIKLERMDLEERSLLVNEAMHWMDRIYNDYKTIQMGLIPK